MSVSSSRKRSSQEDGLTFSGSFEQFVDYAGAIGAYGGGTAGGGYRAPRAPAPSPAPTKSVPPTDDPIDYGDNDPSNFPPFVDPNDPIFEPKEPGSAEPPPSESEGESESTDLPTVVVRAPETPSFPQATYLGDAAFPFAAAPSPAPRRPARKPTRRRAPPPPKRRPVRRTAPVRPRIPIAVPEIPEVKVTAPRAIPYAVLLSLVPPYLRMLGRIDQYGTDAMFHRLFPVGDNRERKPRDDQRPGSPNPDAPGMPDVDIGQPIDTVVVTGTRPSPFPAPAPLPGVSLKPGFRIDPEVPVNPFRPPAQRAKPEPRARFKFDPSPVGAPYVLPQPFEVPASEPRALPKPSPAPTPSPRPRPNPSPSPAPIATLLPIASPGAIGSPISDPIAPGTSTGPLPLERRCSCRIVDPNKKRKPKKHAEHQDHAELEVEYKTKFGKLKVEGIAKKYCVKAPGKGARICYEPEKGLASSSLAARILKRLRR